MYWVHLTQKAPLCHLHGFPQQWGTQMVSLLLFFVLPEHSLYFPQILQFLFFHESIYSKRAKCKWNHSSFACPYILYLKKRVC